MEKTTQKICETELKSMQETIRSTIEKFDTLRMSYVNEHLDYILSIANELERLKYVVERLSSVGGAYIDEYNSNSEDLYFACNISDVNELTDICKKCFPNHNVSWAGPGDTGYEDPQVILKKKVSEAKLKKVQAKLAKVQADQKKMNDEMSNLRREEHKLRSTLQDCC